LLKFRNKKNKSKTFAGAGVDEIHEILSFDIDHFISEYTSEDNKEYLETLDSLNSLELDPEDIVAQKEPDSPKFGNVFEYSTSAKPKIEEENKAEAKEEDDDDDSPTFGAKGARK